MSHCGMNLKLENSRKRTAVYKEYFCVITTYKQYQVVRFFYGQYSVNNLVIV